MKRFSFSAVTGFTTNTLILAVTAFLLAFSNGSMVRRVLEIYPLSTANAPAVLSLVLTVGGVTVLMLGLLCFKGSTKPVLITLLLLSSLAAYFMDNYGVIISDDMLRNVAHTNTAEALDLFSLKLMVYIGLLGIVARRCGRAIAGRCRRSAHRRSREFCRWRLAGRCRTSRPGTQNQSGASRREPPTRSR